MSFDYFYGIQAEQFSFYRIPKALFTDPRFRGISAEAKVLYGILLDRMSLSQKNGWQDSLGRIYIIFTIEEIMEAIGCADQKATKLLSELEKKCGLIERRRQGLGRPNLLYVKNFIDSPDSRFKNRENHDSGIVDSTIQESPKSRSSNTDKNKTDMSDTDINPIPSPSLPQIHDREAYRSTLRENVEYAALLTEYPFQQDAIDEIIELMADTVCSRRSSVRIAGDNKPLDVVRSRFLQINSDHIRYVLDSLRENATEIRNIKQYLLSALYNATLTISSYYQNKVNHDLYDSS